MALLYFKTFIVLIFALLVATAHSTRLDDIIESLEDSAVRRCGPGCNEDKFEKIFNHFLTTCNNGWCLKDFVLRVTPLGSTSYIQQYCVLSEPIHSPKWSVRIQVDLIPQGARMVLVAVPRIRRTEPENFRRPYLLSQIIPRSQLFIVNHFVQAFCGVTV